MVGSGSGRINGGRSGRPRSTGGFDNVIPFPGPLRAAPSEPPPFSQAIDGILHATDGILHATDDPGGHATPLLPELATTTMVALLHSAVGEPDALGPPDSLTKAGPGPSNHQLRDACRQLVGTLVDLARGEPLHWPDPPDAQAAIDAIHALSVLGGPLAEPARQAMAEYGFRPHPHLAHLDTAVAVSAYEIVNGDGAEIELLFELRYPNLDDEAPHPAYLTRITPVEAGSDDLLITGVRGAEDVSVMLQGLTEACSRPKPGGPTAFRPIELSTALSTLSRALERFDAAIGGATDPAGAQVGRQQRFMRGFLRRSGFGADQPALDAEQLTLTDEIGDRPVLVADRDDDERAASATAGGEPFDSSGVPDELVERTTMIAEQASSLALTVFDNEFVALVRRFTAHCAGLDGCPFGRGRPDLWSAAVVYAVAQLNDIPGGWNRLSMDASDLTDRLPGAHATITAKARQLRQLLERDRYRLGPDYRHSGTEIDIGALAELFVGLGPAGVTAGAPGPHDRFEGAASRPIGVGRQIDLDDGACFVLHVSLIGSKPEIWRRLRLPATATFSQLHAVLQLVFGWYGMHLHDFDVDGYRIGPSDADGWGMDCDGDETTVTLADVLTSGARVMYTYDFGDGWEHGIVVEGLELDGATREYGPWAVLGGAMAAPPEDCGGVWGYRELLAARRNRRHPRRGELAYSFPPGFDPAHFDLATINQAVRNRRW